MVTCLYLNTKKTDSIHFNYLKDFKRPDTYEWTVSDSEMKRISAEADLDLETCIKADLSKHW